MQVGSLVKNTKVFSDAGDPSRPEAFPIVGNVYTVRGMYTKNGNVWLWLVEIVNTPRQYTNSFGEKSFAAANFREVQSPMEVSEIFADQLKLSNENRINK